MQNYWTIELSTDPEAAIPVAMPVP
jgi:Ca2+-binding EF-hand superfamily protein